MFDKRYELLLVFDKKPVHTRKEYDTCNQRVACV